MALTQIEAFQGSFLRAREVLTQCLQHNPDDADVHAAYAELLMNARETGHPKNTTSSANFRSEIVDACKSVLRVDPTSKTALMTLWKMIDRETPSFERERRFFSEPSRRASRRDPSPSRAWLMPATMLTVSRVCAPYRRTACPPPPPPPPPQIRTNPRGRRRRRRRTRGAEVRRRAARRRRHQSRLRRRQRLVAGRLLQTRKPRLRAGRRGEGRPPAPGALRAKFIVLRVLFPRRAPEQYESVYERLENIAKHRDSGASFKAYASALKTRARERRACTRGRRRREGKRDAESAARTTAPS